MTRDSHLHPELQRDPSLPTWPEPIPITELRRRVDDRIAQAMFILSQCAWRHEPRALDQALRALGLPASKRTEITTLIARTVRSRGL
jgi:hypothetical protein